MSAQTKQIVDGVEKSTLKCHVLISVYTSPEEAQDYGAIASSV